MSEENNNQGQQNSQGAKQASQKVANMAAKKLMGKGSMMGPLAHVLIAIAPILIIVIFLIGILLFLLTMPGMVMENLKKLFGEMANAVAAFFGANATSQVKDEEVYKTLDYLEDMGYDLKGFGFLTDYVGDSDDGVERAENGKISNAESDFIFTYIVSDNYVYTLKNDNLATQESANGWFESFFTGLVTGFSKVANFIYGPIFDALGVTNAAGEAWGQGLIALYYDKGTVGEEGNWVNDDSLWNRDSVKINGKSLEITSGGFLLNRNTISFNMNGWSGRYGMPLEFLLSVHVATMMPDLAYDMATSFPTNVKIYLHELEDGEVTTAYKSDNKYITNKQLAHVFNFNEPSDVGIYSAYELGIPHAPDCTGDDTANARAFWKGHELKEDEHGYYYQLEEGEGHGASDGGTRRVTAENEIQEPVKKNVPIYCENCIKWVKEISRILNKDSTSDLKSYTPYIARVTNHWYRDVHFVQLDENSETKFVDYDYDYEAITGERWTLYETYEDGNKKGQFKLYKVNEDGSVSDTLYEGTREEAEKENIEVSKKAKTIDANEDTYTDLRWEKNSEGHWTAYKEDETKNSSGFKRIYDDNSEELQEQPEGITKTIMQNAYMNVETIGSIVQTGEGLRTETNNTIKKMFLKNKYFKYDGTTERAEIITALRNKMSNKRTVTKTTKITNGYNGNVVTNTTTTVEQDIEKPYGPLDNINGRDYTNEEYTVKVKNAKGDEEEKKVKVSDYAGKVSLNQDSLNAFSMLENTHTLDADFIYRDFKELIVELGYFDKEDLTESTPRLLQWIVPNISSAGFPYRSLDKNENEFGTMVHSKGDIDANEKTKILNRLEGFLEEEKEHTDGTIPGGSSRQGNTLQPIGDISNINIRTSTHITDTIGSLDGEKSPSQVSVSTFLNAAAEIHSKMEGGDWEYCAAGNHSGDSSRHTSDGSCPGNYATFEAANNAGRTADCSSYVSWVLQEVGIIKGRYSSRGMYSALAEYILTKEEAGELKAGDIVLTEGHVQINGENNLQYNAGTTDAIRNPPKSYVPSYTHVIRLPFSGSTNQASEASFEGYKGNDAVVSPVTGILLDYGTYDGNKDKSSVTKEKYRQNIDLKYDPDKPDLVGYAKILVLDAKNYKKLESLTDNPWKNDSLLTTEKKLDEEGNEKIIAHFSDSEGEWLLDDEKRLSDKNLDSNTNDPWTEIAKTVYGYKEFAESYESGGIAGYIVYIDGFKCELPDEEFDETNLGTTAPSGKEIGKSDFKKVTSASLQTTEPLDEESTMDSLYKKDEVHSMPSKTATEKLKATASVKEQANSTICVKDRGKDLVFIKEGTVLGRTLTDYELIVDYRHENYEDYRKENSSDGDSDKDVDINKLKQEKDKVIGNYLRIIFKDTDDTVVENVEDYMKLDEAGKKNGIFGELEDINENSTHAEKIRAAVTYFNSMGFTPEAACGILGNIIQESTLDPKATSAYHGLIQWDNDVRWPKVKEWMASQGYNEDSFAGQIRAIYELEVNQMDEDKWQELKILTDVERAAELFAVYFERCTGGGDTPVWYQTGELYQELVERKKWAQNAYDIYMGDDSKGVKDP